MSEVAAYVTVEPVHIAVYVSEAAPSGGGVTDHGALTGLSDDDHPQYHNDSRGDARYVQKSTPQATLIGRASGAGTGDAQQLSANQASTILDGATDPFVRTSDLPAGGTGDVVGPSSSTDNNVPQWDGTTGKLLKDGLGTSLGGNEAADAGKLAKYSSTGQLAAGVASGAALRGISSDDEGVHGTSANGTALYGNVTGAGAIGLRITHQGASGDFIRAWNGGADQQFVVDRLGAISWPNGGTGPQTTASNLPAFGSSTKGVVPASGGGTSNFLRADGTWAAPGVADGDKGDVTVSASGATWTIDNNAVTNAKAADMATRRIKGRVSSGTGDPEDLTPDDASDILDQATNAFIRSSQSATNIADAVAAEAALRASGDTATLSAAQSHANGKVSDSISDGVTTVAPSQNAVFDALALKADASSATNASNLSSGTVANARLDALLAAIGNLTTAADKMIRLTGTDTVDQVDLKLGVSAAYSGSLTWTGTGPTGTANNTQWFTHVGNLVTWRICITYASAGSGITGLTATLPAEFPTPAIPTGFEGANAFIAACHAGRFITTPTGSLTINTNCNLKRNAANNGFEIVATIASGNYRSVILSGSYHTA